MTSSENIAAKTLEGKTARQEECLAGLGRGSHTSEVPPWIQKPLCGMVGALGESDHKQWVSGKRNDLFSSLPDLQTNEVLNLGPNDYFKDV